MFNFFKRKSGVDKFKRWDIHVEPGFEMIINPDSIQYVNKDENKVIYLSLLKVEGKSVLADSAFSETPRITKDDYGWNLRGVKQSPEQLLVCVISFTDQGDSQWAISFFDSIRYKGNA